MTTKANQLAIVLSALSLQPAMTSAVPLELDIPSGSAVTISSGHFHGIRAFAPGPFGDGTLNLTGNIVIDSASYSSSGINRLHVNVAGGTYGRTFINETTNLTISGGEFTDGIECLSSSTVTLLGGKVDFLSAVSGQCNLNWFGGSITGSVGGLSYAWQNINVFGYDFKFAFLKEDVHGPGRGRASLSGFLQNGSQFDIILGDDDGDLSWRNLNLVETRPVDVPEPSPLGLLGVSLLTAYIARRRRVGAAL